MQLFLSREALEAIPLPEALTNHAVGWFMAGFRQQVLQLQEEVPDGCVGIQHLMHEGRLLSEDYLRIDPFGRLTFKPISQVVKK